MSALEIEVYEDDFVGASVAFPTAANIGTPWTCVLTGAPTNFRNAGEAVISLVVADTSQNACLHHADALAFDIDDIRSIEMLVRLSAPLTSGTILTFGVGSARANDADAVAAHATFRMVGATSTSAVFVETDDAVRDIDDIATGQTLGATYKRFFIDFANGKSDVRFFMDDSQGNLTRVASQTLFDMSGYSAGLQPIVQLQKPSGTAVDAVRVDRITIKSRRRV